MKPEPDATPTQESGRRPEPEGHTRANGGARTDQELLELCHLVIGLPREDLHAALQRISDRAAFTESLSEVLADAIRLGQARNENFAEAIAPVISRGVHETVQRDASAFGKALAPAMGPAIRQSVLFMIRGLLDSFETMVAQRLSIRSLMWRYEAWRTGRSFQEVFFLKTLVYRVEHALLIHRETGVLLARVSAPDAPVADPELVSAMLTAIQDFVSDAFVAPAGDTLGSFQVGELSVLVEDSEAAVLAGVVRGVPKQQVRLQLRETLEQIQLHYASTFATFNGDTAPFDACEPLLQGCIQRQAIHASATNSAETLGQKLKHHWLLCTVVLALMLAGLTWGILDSIESARYERFATALLDEPGVTVTHAAWTKGRFVLRGLRDPLARDPAILAADRQLDAAVLDQLWQPMITATPGFVARRFAHTLTPPPGVSIVFEAGILRISGAADHAWIQRCRRLATLVPGVQDVDLANVTDADAAALDTARQTLTTTSLTIEKIGDANAAELGRVRTALEQLAVAATALRKRVEVVATVYTPSASRNADTKAAVEFLFRPFANHSFLTTSTKTVAQESNTSHRVAFAVVAH